MAGNNIIIQLLANTGSFDSDIRRSERLLRDFGGSSGATSASAVALGAALTAVGAAISIAFGRAIEEAEKFNQNQARTQAILKATGNSVGLTGQEIKDFADELENVTLGKTFEEASQKLLTFKSVTGDVFKETLRLSQDLAATGFGVLESNVVQLGKALENPVQGLSALAEAGITFTRSQKEVIAALVETGETLKVQNLILKAVRDQVGGAGEAEAQGLTGAYHRLADAVDDFFTRVGNSSPLAIFQKDVEYATKLVNILNDALFPTDAQRTNDLLERRGQLLQAQENPNSTGVKKVIEENLAAIETEIQAIKERDLAEANSQQAARDAGAQAAAQRLAEAEASKASEAAEKAAAEAEKNRLDLAKQAASAAEAEEKRRLAAIQSIIGAIQSQNDALTKSRETILAEKLQTEGATEEQILFALALQQTNLELTERKKLLEEGDKLRESLRTPKEQFQATTEKLDTLAGAGVDTETISRARQAATKALEDSLEQEKQARQSARDALFEGLLTEEEEIAQSYERRKELILKATEVTETERQDLIGRLDESRRQQTADAEFQRNTQILDAGAELFGSLAGLSRAYAGEQSTAYRVLFGIQKAFALASATLNLANAIGKALDAPPPLSFAQVGAVIAAFGQVFSVISSATFSGGAATGGSVSEGRKYLVGERGPEMFVPNTSGFIVPNNMLGGQQTPSVNIRNINAFDLQLIGDYLGSDSGERTVVNIVRRNSENIGFQTG